MDSTTLISLGFTGGTMAYRELWEKYLERSADAENMEEFQNAIEMIADSAILTKKEKEQEKRLEQLEQQSQLIRQRINAINQQQRRVSNSSP